MGGLRGTARQTQILELASRGQSDKEIAIALGISVHTVRSHLQRLYRTHSLANRAEAVAAWVGQDVSLQASASDGEFEKTLSDAAQVAASARLPVQTVEARAQLELVNHERQTMGLAALEWDDTLAQLARLSALQMAEQGHLATGIATSDVEGLEVTAENVGYWAGMNDVQLHGLFIADPKQRANVIEPHRALGAAWATTDSAVSFLSVVFG